MTNRKAKTPEAKANQIKHLRHVPKKENPANNKKNLPLTDDQLRKLEAITNDREAREAVIRLLPPAYRCDLETGQHLKTWQAIVRNFIETWPI